MVTDFILAVFAVSTALASLANGLMDGRKVAANLMSRATKIMKEFNEGTDTARRFAELVQFGIYVWIAYRLFTCQ